MRLPQLQEMAAGLGIKGYRRLRKSELIDAIQTARTGGGIAPTADAPAQPRTRSRRTASGQPTEEARSSQTDGASASAGSAGVASASAPAASAPAGSDSAPSTAAPAPDQGQGADSGAQAAARTSADGQRQVTRRRGGNDAQSDDASGAATPPAQADGQPARQQGEARGGDSRGAEGRGGDTRDSSNGRDDRQGRGGDSRQGDNRQDRGGDSRQGDTRQNRGGDNRQADNRQGDNRQADNRQGDNRQFDNRAGGRDNDRRSRNRGRDRKRRGRGEFDEPELRPDDVLIPVGGILDVHDNYAFLRTSGYLPGPDDVYVSANMVKKHGLRKGDAIVGAIRQSRDGEQRTSKREKFDALVRLDSVSGLSVEDAKRRVEFSKLTPLYPQERLRMETTSKQISTRIIDLVAPIGKGQRGLIVSPAKAGKTSIMQQISNAITANNPEVHLMVVLVDERPEEVTEMQRAVQGEVIHSTFDRPAEDHTTIAELAIERAKRLVELGTDVVLLLDSITRLGRAYNLAQPASGRILSGGVDANALYPPKRFFGAARNIEGGGSLTILATALVETGSKMDEVIFEEFKGTGNMELRLSRHLADKRIYPAVDVNASGTRREENLMHPEERKVMWKLRRVLSGLEQQQALELLLSKLKETGSNAEFLMQVQKTTPLPKSASDE
nr:transcription termination factor Rho [Brevibacterium daeguense]